MGLAAGGGRRQTPGLRRSELATVAGVSVDYLIRLEQGRDTNPSPSVLDALATALRLDEDERAHLHRLAGHGAAARPSPSGAAVRPGLLRLLEAVRPAPAYVLDDVSNVLALNEEGRRLLPGIEGNLVRYVFTHPAAREVFAGWADMARDCVAHLRTVGDCPARAELVAELRAASPDFAVLWRDYRVRVKRGARRTFRHPCAGELVLESEIVTAADGRRLAVFQPVDAAAGAALARLA